LVPTPDLGDRHGPLVRATHAPRAGVDATPWSVVPPKRRRRFAEFATTSTSSGSNCLPENFLNSSIVRSKLSALRYGRSVVIASRVSAIAFRIAASTFLSCSGVMFSSFWTWGRRISWLGPPPPSEEASREFQVRCRARSSGPEDAAAKNTSPD